MTSYVSIGTRVGVYHKGNKNKPYALTAVVGQVSRELFFAD